MNIILSIILILNTEFINIVRKYLSLDNQVLPIDGIDLLHDPWNPNKLKDNLNKNKYATTNIHFVNGRLDPIFNGTKYQPIIDSFMNGLRITPQFLLIINKKVAKLSDFKNLVLIEPITFHVYDDGYDIGTMIFISLNDTDRDRLLSNLTFEWFCSNILNLPIIESQNLEFYLEAFSRPVVLNFDRITSGSFKYSKGHRSDDFYYRDQLRLNRLQLGSLPLDKKLYLELTGLVGCNNVMSGECGEMKPMFYKFNNYYSGDNLSHF